MSTKLPIVYSPGYNMTLMGIEKKHPFDSAKYGKAFEYLKEHGILTGDNHHEPTEPVSDEVLLRVHTPEYLELIKTSKAISAISELRALKAVPAFILRNRLLKPMRLGTQGSIMGIQLAWEHGWAINLAGGYHHAKGHFAHGFCFFSDIPLAAYHLMDKNPNMRVMVIDLDAHQGNGFEGVFKDDPRIINFDVYNGKIFPQDHDAGQYIHYNFPIDPGTKTEAYLQLVKWELPQALDKEKPDLVIYNAGTDIYEKDPLGELAVSAAGIIERDLFVFDEVFEKRGIPILKLLSGGYIQESYKIIGASTKNLFHKLDLGNKLSRTPQNPPSIS